MSHCSIGIRSAPVRGSGLSLVRFRFRSRLDEAVSIHCLGKASSPKTNPRRNAPECYSIASLLAYSIKNLKAFYKHVNELEAGLAAPSGIMDLQPTSLPIP